MQKALYLLLWLVDFVAECFVCVTKFLDKHIWLEIIFKDCEFQLKTRQFSVLSSLCFDHFDMLNPYSDRKTFSSPGIHAKSM